MEKKLAFQLVLWTSCSYILPAQHHCFYVLNNEIVTRWCDWTLCHREVSLKSYLSCKNVFLSCTFFEPSIDILMFFFRQIMTLHSVCFILQNIFHFLCERNNGQVPLPAANTVSRRILSPVTWCFFNAVHDKDIKLLFWFFDWLTFVAERRSLENILPRTCSWDSEWVCHSIWDWKYLPSNDVSKILFYFE